MSNERDKTGTVPRPIAWMEGRVVPASEATVPLLDDGFLRGDAVFDAVLVRRGRTHALEAHLARLRRSGREMGIRVPAVEQVVTDLLAAWGQRDGVVKIIVTRAGTLRGLIQPADWPDAVALSPVEVPWRSALSGVKTVSYAVNAWASRQAGRAHADDAVIISEGVVQEVPTAAIAWVVAGDVRSPDPDRLPILRSVTLQKLAAVVDISFGVYPLSDLLEADEVFIASASRPVLAVHAVDDRSLPAPGPVTRRIRKAFDRHVEATLDPPL